MSPVAWRPSPLGRQTGVLAFDQTVYDSLKYIHVVASIVWVGSGLYFQFQGTRLRRVDDPSQLAVFAQQVAATGTTLLVPASLLMLAAGIALVLYTPTSGSPTRGS